MTTIHRLHLFQFLNNKAFYSSFSVFVDTDGNVFDLREEVKSFGRIVDWILDVIDNIVFEWVGIGYFVDNLRFRKWSSELLRWLEKRHEETT